MFARDGTRLVTGGADGALRVWAYPALRLLHAVAGAHPGQVEDLDIDPAGLVVVSTDRTARARLWRVADASSAAADLAWAPSAQAAPFAFRTTR